MKLSELCLEDGETVVADGEYDCMGLLKTRIGRKILSYIQELKYLKEAENDEISCIICKKEMLLSIPKHITGVIISNEPQVTFWRIHNMYGMQKEKKETQIGKNVEISPLACIPSHNVTIGDNVIIEEFVSIKENVTIGNNVIIRTGSVIGGAGFEFKERKGEEPYAVEHYGGVVIGNGVEVQQLSHVGKAIFGWDNTIIGNGTKVDSLVHIAHCAKIGNNCRIVAGTVIGGSANINNDVWIGPNSIISNGLTVADRARISLGSVVTKDVGINETVTGNFAIEHNLFLQNLKESIKKSNQ